MNTTDTVLREQADHAHKVQNDDAKDMSVFAAGDVMPQGDLYIVGLKSLPKSAKPRMLRQLAEGGTRGSQHVHEGGDIYDCDPGEVVSCIKYATGREIAPQYIGPVFVGGSIRHPEHGDHENYPAGQVCAVVYQRSLDAEEREARVQD